MSIIQLIGNVPPDDMDSLRTAAVKHDVELQVEAGCTPSSGTRSAALVAGYFSFLPCEPDTVLELFGSRPVGFGNKIPFFQRVGDAASPPDFLDGLPVFGYFASPISAIDASNMVGAVVQQSVMNKQVDDLIGEVIKYRKQKHQLITIGTALTSQNDLESLLNLILRESRDMVNADAGSIYIRERTRTGGPFTGSIRFKVSQNDSVDVAEKTREFVIRIDTRTIAGYVASTGKPLMLEDVYRIAGNAPYRFGRDFDEKFGYRMKSMMTVPLKNLNGEVVGVLQLMNKKMDRNVCLSSPESTERSVTQFTLSDQDVVLSIASLAAVAIERIQLYESIQMLFEGFLNSSITAIDERDRVTSGHSRRVMGYAMAFVDAINAAKEGAYAMVAFSEDRKRQFKFAALLHDIGKIGVPEAVLTKERKLGSGDMDALMMRLDYVTMQLRLSPDQVISWITPDELEDDRAFVRRINLGGFLSDAELLRLEGFKEKRFRAIDGTILPILNDGQFAALSVRRGNLTDPEREMINSHAQSTRRLLSKIPWNRDLEQIPEIACHHHEKLDGTGYPDGLKGEAITLESRILAVIDIYEALVAQDRPYKPKIPPERAIEILRAEVTANHLDGDVVEFFVASGVYRIFFTAADTVADKS